MYWPAGMYAGDHYPTTSSVPQFWCCTLCRRWRCAPVSARFLASRTDHGLLVCDRCQRADRRAWAIPVAAARMAAERTPRELTGRHNWPGAAAALAVWEPARRDTAPDAGRQPRAPGGADR